VVYGAWNSGVGFLTGMWAHAANGAAHIDANDGKSFHEPEQWVNAIESVITDLKEASAEISTPITLNTSHGNGHAGFTAANGGVVPQTKTKTVHRTTTYQTQVVRPECFGIQIYGLEQQSP